MGRFVSWGSLAFLAASVCLAEARLAAWLFVENGPFLAGVWDAAHVILVGVIVAALAALGQSLAKVRVWLPWAALGLLSLALGEVLLEDDVGGFSRRQEMVPQSIAFHGVVAALSLSPVVAAVLGRGLDEPRWRWGALVGAALLVVVNGTVLHNDYWGVHAFLSLSALVGAGAAFWSAKGRLPRLKQWPTLSASFLIFAPSVVFTPSSRTTATLATSTGAPFSHFIANLRPSGYSPTTVASSSVWLTDRATVSDVEPSQERPLAAPPFVVLITIDALRADVVYSKLHDRLLPTLSRLRDEGLVFSQARAAGTLTKTSLSSLFMGNYFSQQYWSPMDKAAGAMSVHADETRRFTEYLTDSGVHTENVRAISWLRNGVVMRGFQRQRHINYPKKQSYYTPSPPVFQHLLPRVGKLLKRQKPSFIYCHLADPHAPYDQGKLQHGPAFSRYLSEVELVDSQLALLVELIEKAEGRGESVLLIISADHGESFGEHNSRTHGTTMYDEVLHVPLIFWTPGGQHRTIDDLVSLVDLGPTILDLFNVPTPGRMMGQSLAGYLNGDSPELTRPIFAETRLMRALVTPERMKLIWDVRSNRLELYDLTKDPQELENIAEQGQLVVEPFGFMRRFFEVHTLKRDGYRPPFVK